jgi:cytidylate kinase
MAIITIRGTLGSGAPEIGKLIADRLHIDYIDREIIAQVAEQIQRPKQDIAAKEMPSGSLLGRISEALERNAYYRASAYLPTWEIPLEDTQYLPALESVITDIARSGSIVIRGRGSQFILKDLPRALHVLVVAPLDLRVKRIMESSKIEESEVRKMIQRFDSSRRMFTKRYFHAVLEDPINYDLVINTEHLSFEHATSIIIGALSFKDKNSFTQKE